MFICGGAFAGLDKVIRQRTDKCGIGFSAEVTSKTDSKSISETIRNVEPEDLIKFGLIPEFVGRLPIIAVLDELEVDALISILIEPKNALTKQYKKLFEMESVELEFREDALRVIAEKAAQRKTGARGLRSILEGILLDTMYEIPSMADVNKVVIDSSVVRGDSAPIMIFAKSEKAKNERASE